MKISQLPEDIKQKALEYQKKADCSWCKNSDILEESFDFENTEEGWEYWDYLHYNTQPELLVIKDDKLKDILKVILEKPVGVTPVYYDNSKGTIYKFCDDQNLNSYEFDIIKRIVRCRKKGNFIEDLEKTKVLVDLYLKEHVNQ